MKTSNKNRNPVGFWEISFFMVGMYVSVGIAAKSGYFVAPLIFLLVAYSYYYASSQDGIGTLSKILLSIALITYLCLPLLLKVEFIYMNPIEAVVNNFVNIGLFIWFAGLVFTDEKDI